MKTKLSIFKTGVAVAFATIVGFGCGQQDTTTEAETDTGTADAIVAGDSSAANLNEPRPAPIGDTSVNANQADQFGEMNPNQDSAARALEELDKQKEQQKPKP